MPSAQNAEAVLGVMVGYALDDARQHFLGSIAPAAQSSVSPSLCFHRNSPQSRGTSKLRCLQRTEDGLARFRQRMPPVAACIQCGFCRAT